MAFSSRNQGAGMGPQAKYRTARINILAAILFTAVNIVLLFATQAGTYFLFSLYVPYYIVTVLYVQCGFLPEEFYQESGVEMTDLLPREAVTVGIVIAVLILAVYLVCYFLSKRKPGFMTVSLVLIGVDTLFVAYTMITGAGFSVILDVLFHVWLLYYAISAVRAAAEMKKIPVGGPEVEDISQDSEDSAAQGGGTADGQSAEGAEEFAAPPAEGAEEFAASPDREETAEADPFARQGDDTPEDR